MVLSVCIPCAPKRAGLLEEAAESAAAALPPDSELLVLPDGAEASEMARQARLPAAATVIESSERLGLCRNWNRCLKESSGRLVHLLHDDDRVLEGFYSAVLGMRERFPSAALYGTAYASLVDGAPPPAGASGAGQPVLLEGPAAAKALLDDERHTCGSVVVTRAAVERAGPFDERFPYCPDEEAYLRWAHDGGLAFDPAPLYLNRPHPDQARYGTWARPDFVSSYIGARRTGAARYGADAERLAETTATTRVIRLAQTLARQGDGRTAAARLADLRAHAPGVWARPGYWAAWLAARTLGYARAGRASNRT